MIKTNSLLSATSCVLVPMKSCSELPVNVLTTNIDNFGQQLLTLTEAYKSLQQQLKLVLAQNDEPSFKPHETRDHTVTLHAVKEEPLLKHEETCNHFWNGDDRTQAPHGLGEENGKNGENGASAATAANEAPRYVDVEIGMAMLTALTRDKVETARVDLEEQEGTAEQLQKLTRALEIMALEVTELNIAEAYNLLRDARKTAPQLCEDQCKAASMALRELLFVHICSCRGAMTPIAFEYALEHAFQGQLSSELRSQVHLARSAICRLGASEANFRIEFQKCFATQLTSQEATALYGVYATAASSIGDNFKQPKKQTRPNRKTAADAKPDAISATAVAFADTTEPLRVAVESEADPMIYIHKCYKCGNDSLWCINADLQCSRMLEAMTRSMCAENSLFAEAHRDCPT